MESLVYLTITLAGDETEFEYKGIGDDGNPIAIQPDVLVNGKKPSEWYDIEYDHNKEVNHSNDPKPVVKVTDKVTGATGSVEFDIVPAELNGTLVINNTFAPKYTGDAIVPEKGVDCTLVYNGKTIPEDEYELNTNTGENYNNVNANSDNSAVVKAYAKSDGNYKDSTSVPTGNFSIAKRSIAEAYVFSNAATDNIVAYPDGDDTDPTGSIELTYKNETNEPVFKGSSSTSTSVWDYNISFDFDQTSSLKSSDFTVAFTKAPDNSALTGDEPKTVGKYYMTLTGSGENIEGEKKKIPFSIISESLDNVVNGWGWMMPGVAYISSAVKDVPPDGIIKDESFIYNGDQIIPQIVLKKDNNAINFGENKILYEGTDYIVIPNEYCIDACEGQNKAAVTIKGIGNYKGDFEKTIHFSIQRVSLNDERINIDDNLLKKTVRGERVPNLFIKDNGVKNSQRKVLSDEDYEGILKSYKYTVGKGSKGTIPLTIEGLNNYKDTVTDKTFSYGTDLSKAQTSGSSGVVVSVQQNAVTAVSVASKEDDKYGTGLDIFDFDFDNTAPEFELTDYYETGKSYVLKSGADKDYTITYSKRQDDGTFVEVSDGSRKNVGVYKVEIEGNDPGNLVDPDGDFYYNNYAFLYEIHKQTIDPKNLYISDANAFGTYKNNAATATAANELIYPYLGVGSSITPNLSVHIGGFNNASPIEIKEYSCKALDNAEAVSYIDTGVRGRTRNHVTAPASSLRAGTISLTLDESNYSIAGGNTVEVNYYLQSLNLKEGVHSANNVCSSFDNVNGYTVAYNITPDPGPYTYDGSVQKPDCVVSVSYPKASGISLNRTLNGTGEDWDYWIRYENNSSTNADTYKYYIQGKGGNGVQVYVEDDPIEKTYTIEANSLNPTLNLTNTTEWKLGSGDYSGKHVASYTGNTIKPEFTVTGNLSGKSVNLGFIATYYDKDGVIGKLTRTVSNGEYIDSWDPTTGIPSGKSVDVADYSIKLECIPDTNYGINETTPITNADNNNKVYYAITPKTGVTATVKWEDGWTKKTETEYEKEYSASATEHRTF